MVASSDSQPWIRRARARLTVALVLLIALLLPRAAGAADPVVLQLRWDHQFQFAGYYAALWKGYYAAAGLDVEIRSALRPDGPVRLATKEVEEGRATFGVGAADILVARDKGADLVVLATFFQKSPVGFYAMPETRLSTPADLVGLRVLRVPGDVIDVELNAMLRLEGIDPALIPYPQLPPFREFPRTIVNRGAEVMQGFQISTPWQFRELGVESLKVLRPSDYGVDFYGDSLFASGRLIADDPGLVERFKKASIEGWRYALENPEEIADRISRTYAPLGPIRDFAGFNRFQAGSVRDLTLHPIVDPGHTNPRRWARMHEFLRGAGLVSGDFDPMAAVFDPDLRARQRLEGLQRVAWWVAAALALSATALWMIAMRRTVRAQTRAIRERDERLSAALAASNTGTFRWDFRTDRVQWDASTYRLYGRDPANPIGTTAEILPLTYEADRETVAAGMAQSRTTLGDFATEFRVVHPDGAVRWLALAGKVFPDPDGLPLYMTGALTDVTDRKAAEERQRLLAHEVDHRAKNLLATVQGMFARTVGHAGSVEAVTAAFQGRIEAMSRAHDLLTKASWEGVGLRDLVADELTPYAARPEQLARVEGPPVRLRPKAALALGMVLHELATNAAKYGALSQPDGRLDVRWSVDREGLRLSWCEQNGPPVRPPSRRGFGSTLIEQVLSYEVKGAASLEFPVEGVRCTVRVPADHVADAAEAAEPAPPPLDGPRPAAPAVGLAGKRILIVEDVMLIAMTVEAALSEAGAEPVGPASDVASALAMVEVEALDGAILDVNLNGEESFPIADALSRRGVPVVFATGYDGSSVLPPRFAAAPVLRKPFNDTDIRHALALAFGAETVG